MSEKQIEITFIVNGQPVLVKAIVDAPIRLAVKDALEDSGNSGQPFDNWELRDASGQIIDFDKEIGDLVLDKNTKFFLNLKAGVGG